MDTVEELNGTYFYKGYTQLTPQQLWWLITVDALREHLGDQRCRCRPDRIRTTLASHAPKAGDRHTRHVNRLATVTEIPGQAFAERYPVTDTGG